MRGATSIRSGLSAFSRVRRRCRSKRRRPPMCSRSRSPSPRRHSPALPARPAAPRPGDRPVPREGAGGSSGWAGRAGGAAEPRVGAAARAAGRVACIRQTRRAARWQRRITVCVRHVVRRATLRGSYGLRVVRIPHARCRLYGRPVGVLINRARRLFNAGFGHGDIGVAFKAEIDRSREERSFGLGHGGGPSLFERILRWISAIGFGTALFTLAGVLAVYAPNPPCWLRSYGQ